MQTAAEACSGFQGAGIAKALQWEPALPRGSVAVAEGVRGRVAVGDPAETKMEPFMRYSSKILGSHLRVLSSEVMSRDRQHKGPLRLPNIIECRQ